MRTKGREFSRSVRQTVKKIGAPAKRWRRAGVDRPGTFKSCSQAWFTSCARRCAKELFGRLFEAGAQGEKRELS